MGRVRAAGTTLAAGVLALAGAVPAVAGGAPEAPRVRVQALSGPSPFATGCAGGGELGRISGAEVEPAITADPADPRKIVGTWQQDIGVFAARSDLIATTQNGGRTWRRSIIPGLTTCSGGSMDFASDPWLSTGVDGTVYFSGTSGLAISDPPPVQVVTSRSTDGGRSWHRPVTVAGMDVGNDTDAITASPTRPGHAYLVWATWDHTYQPPMTNFLRFSRTSDGGASWSPAVVIHQPEATAIDFSGHILALPNGTLLAVFANADVVAGRGSLLASRSLDEGRTWQPAITIATQPVGFFPDPETGVELPQPGFPSAAVAPDGTVYVAAEGSSSPSTGAVNIARSRDGGRTWTTSPLPGVSAFAFEPAIAVDSHGTLGVTWQDLRSDRPGDGVLSVDVWFAQSINRGASWRQRHVAGPFDLLTAPRGRLGEYQGLAGLRRGFAAIFTATAPLARNGPSDIFFARIPTAAR